MGKRLVFIILIIFSLVTISYADVRPSGMVAKYKCNDFIGSTSTSLKALKITGDGDTDITDGTPNQYDLITGDWAEVSQISGAEVLTAFYIFYADGTDAESTSGSPYEIIRPADYVNHSKGVWKRTISSGDLVVNEIKGTLNTEVDSGCDDLSVYANNWYVWDTGGAGFGTYAEDGEGTYVQLGEDRTGNGYSFIDLIGDDAGGSDYGLRIIRGNTGENATSSIVHTGTGDLKIETENAASISFKTNDTARVQISATGEVDLNDNDLDNVGAIDATSGTFSGTVYTGRYIYTGLNAVDTQDVALQMGAERTGNGNTYIDLVGDNESTETGDYGLRLRRWDTGENAISEMAHRGTGNLEITTEDAAKIEFKTNDTTRVEITSTGDVDLNDNDLENVSNIDVVNVTFSGEVVLNTESPAATDACTQWEMKVDASYIYICTATGVWKRSALTGGY